MKLVYVLFCILFLASQANAGINNPGTGGGGGPTGTPQTNMGLNGMAGVAFLNLAHSTGGGGSSQVGWPGTLNSAGYPTSATTSNISSNDFSLVPSYYGHYLLYWSGTGALNFGGVPLIAYSGGTAVAAIGAASGATNTNPAIGFNGGTQPTSGTPLEFTIGGLITAVSDGASCTGGTAGLVCLTNGIGSFGLVATGQLIQANHITNLAPGPWTVTVLDSNHIQLQGSSFNGTMAVVGGSPGTASEAILSTGNINWTLPGQGSFGAAYSNMTGMVTCRSQNVGIGGLSDCANIATHFANPDYAAVIKAASPRWVRFMDQTAVQYSFATSFTNRPTVTNFSWGVATYVAGYWAGVLTNAADTYTSASNPTSSPASGPPVDGEVITGVTSAANTTTVPKLAINRTSFGAAKPILDKSIAGLSLFMSGSVPPTATTITLVFTGGGLSSAFSYHYVTSTSVNGPGGALDTSFANIAVNIRADINGNIRGNAGALVTAQIVSENPEVAGANMTFGYNPNINSSGVAALGNGLTITGSDSAASGTYTFGFVPTSELAANCNYAFTYSAIAGGWITTPAAAGCTGLPGTQGGPPLEFYEDLVNQAGVGMWLNIPILYSDAAITSTFQHIATAGVKEVVGAVSNETWNTGGGGQFHPVNSMGTYYGWQSNFDGGTAVDDYTGLRTIQMASAARTGFTNAAVSQAKLFIALEYQFTNPTTERFSGTHITPASNVTLAAYGGSPSNGTTTPGAYATNSSAFPNRPRDSSDFLAPAPYFQGAQFNSSFGGSIITSLNAAIPLAAYNCSLVASYNFVNGNAAEQTAALNFMFNGTTGDFYNNVGLTQATVTASISSGVMNVTAVLTGGGVGTIPFNTAIVSGAGITQPVFITSNGTGSGGNGTYNLSNGSLSVGSETLTISALNTGFALGSWANATGIPSAQNYWGIPTIVAADDASRTGTNPHTGLPWNLLGVASYEGDQQSGPVTAADATVISGNLSTLGDTAGYTSGLTAQCGMTPHSGGPSSTVAGDASNMQALLFGFKNSAQFKALYLKYFNDFKTAVTAPGARIAAPGTYGFEALAPNGGTWSKYPGTIYNTPSFQSLNAIQSFN